MEFLYWSPLASAFRQRLAAQPVTLTPFCVHEKIDGSSWIRTAIRNGPRHGRRAGRSEGELGNLVDSIRDHGDRARHSFPLNAASSECQENEKKKCEDGHPPRPVVCQWKDIHCHRSIPGSVIEPQVCGSAPNTFHDPKFAQSRYPGSRVLNSSHSLSHHKKKKKRGGVT